MKKKLIVATALILIAAFGLALFAGCDRIITRNEERDMTTPVATVKYGEQTATIYKYELAASFNNYAYYYVNYYGMTYEEAAKTVLQSLAQQKLLVLFAKAKVAEMKGCANNFDDLLVNSEKDHAIDEANESLLNSLKQIVQDAITEDNYNSAEADDNKDDTSSSDDEEEITDGVTVRFESNGGSEVERQRVQKNTKIKEPTEPTRDGYTFYGWHKAQLDENGGLKENEEGDGYLFDDEEFNFENTAIEESMTLVAAWEKYTAPRTEMPKEDEEEEEEYDPDMPDSEFTEDKISPKFFSTEYQSGILEELKEEDFYKDIKGENQADIDAKLEDYKNDALEQLKKNLKSNLFLDDENKCYDYYLNAQYESLIVEKLERLIGQEIEKNYTKDAAKAEIEEEFRKAVEQNKETFAGSDTSYSSALTNSLNTTYFHPNMGENKSYGFVINILLRLDDEDLKKLTDMYNANPSEDGKKATVIMRNKLLSEMEVLVSNPAYDSTEKIEKDLDGNDIELRDPMTDKKNPYGYIGATEYDHSYQFNYAEEGQDPKYNDYNQILTFVKDENGKYAIKYQATEHPAMAYLLEKVPAFDKDGKTGIIHQIYNSFKQVEKVADENNMTPAQRVYWLKEVATRWAYLVGDDSGAVTDSSNNGGRGYLITPEGESSSYLKDFTSYARKLVANGTGSYSDGKVDEKSDFAQAGDDGQFAGNNKAFVVADSFIESGSTSNAYTGVFVLLNSYTVWDEDFYRSYVDDLGEKKYTGYYEDMSLDADNGTLSLNYIIDFAEKPDDVKTLYDIIYDRLLESKKTDKYNLEVNALEHDEKGSIQYYPKAYKSLWKDLE